MIEKASAAAAVVTLKEFPTATVPVETELMTGRAASPPLLS